MSHARITIATIPAHAMRYDTLGDWREDGDTLVIEVSDAVPERERVLVALHELVEAVLCLRRGVTTADVDRFDFAFKGSGEPGDAPDAPYQREHRFAMLVEHLMAHEMGLANYGRVE